MIKYKGYVGRIDYEPEDKVFFGEVVSSEGIIAFDGRTPEELEEHFKAAIDSHLENCKRNGIKPIKPLSGELLLRMKPELHQALAFKAKQERKSLNSLICDKLEMAV